MSVSIRAQKEISDQLSSLVATMTTSRSLPDKSQSSAAALSFENGDTEADWPGIKYMFNRARTGEATWGRSSRETPTEDHLGQRSISTQSPSCIAIREQCKAFCSCLCHMRSIVQSPWILETIIGKISVQHVGRRPSCNEFHCRSSPELSLKVVYQFPRYIISRYIYIAMQYTPSSGPELLLRMPRVVPWSHLLWNYANIGNLSAIQKLFADGKASAYDVNPQGSNALIYTRHGHNCSVAQFLLEQGADMDQPNEIDQTPSDLFWEYYFAGQVSCEGSGFVRAILRRSSHVQTQSFSTLHKVILGMIPRDIVSELEISTAAIDVGDSKNRTPLCWATIHNNLQAVKALLAFGANPNIVDRWGHTPLDFAKRVDICKALIDAGVNVRAPSLDYGRSALHQLFKTTGGCSVESDTVEIIDILVNAGIDVNLRDSDDETPLLNAIFSGHTLHVRRLLQLGANPNAFNKSSRESALHFAVIFDRYDMIRLLLEHGADYTAVNVYGKTIGHLAARFASTKTISVLADSNLAKLDLGLHCKAGRTPADYLSERSILTEGEQGLHAEFERFVNSVQVSGMDLANGISEVASVHESLDGFDNLHLPGAYPVSPDPSVSY